jgi:hypothetical protein
VLNQTDVPCPPLFAASAKLGGSLIGTPEVGMRLLPVLSGILLLPLAYAAARSLRLPKMMALTGMALCAGSFMLANWSRELKQYQIEALLSVAAALLTFRIWLAGGKNRWRELAGLAAIGLIGPWLGYGLIFSLLPLAGVLIVLPCPTPGGRRLWKQGAACLAITLGSLAAVMVHVAAKQSSNTALLDYTHHWFIDVGHAYSWLRAGAYGMCTSAMLLLPQGMTNEDLRSPSLAVLALAGGTWLLALAGLWAWPRRTRWAMAFWAIGPWLAMYAAAAAHRYPFGMPRMMALVAPGMLVCAAVGAAAAFRWVTLSVAGRPAVGLALALAVALAPMVLLYDLPGNRNYWIRHDFPAVLKELQARRAADEPVIVEVTATPVVKYYAAGHDGDFLYVPTSGGTLAPLNFDYAGLIEQVLIHHPRKCWLVRSSHDPARSLPNAPPTLIECLEQHGWALYPACEAGGESLGKAQLFSAVPHR